MDMRKYNNNVVEVNGNFKDIQLWDKEVGVIDNIQMMDLDFVGESLKVETDKFDGVRVADFIIDVIEKNLNIKIDYIHVLNDGLISFNIIEDDDGREIMDNEYDDFKDKMYLCDYTILLTINGEYIEVDDIIKIMSSKKGLQVEH